LEASLLDFLLSDALHPEAIGLQLVDNKKLDPFGVIVLFNGLVH
jgi:hypothetical protein